MSSFVLDNGSSPVQPVAVISARLSPPFFLHSFGFPSNPQRFHPAGIFVSQDRIIVADAGNDDSAAAGDEEENIKLFSLAGEFQSSIACQLSESAHRHWSFNGIARVFIDRQILYVVETRNLRIQLFDENGKFMEFFEQEPIAECCFIGPTDLAIRGDRFYLADSENSQILIFDEDRNFISRFGGRGSGSGEFHSSVELAVNDSIIVVADSGNSRIQLFTLEGEFIREMGGPGSEPGQFNPTNGQIGLQATNQFVYCVDTENHRVQIFDLNGNLCCCFGVEGSGAMEFSSPRAIAVAEADGRIYVADTLNQRIQVFERIE